MEGGRGSNIARWYTGVLSLAIDLLGVRERCHATSLRSRSVNVCACAFKCVGPEFARTLQGMYEITGYTVAQ